VVSEWKNLEKVTAYDGGTMTEARKLWEKLT
jgi:hypothetical protein